jgi:hypothetical protein
MFDKISRAAEKAATSVSRRNFLGGLGRGAAALAAGLGGVLLTATDAEASGGKCCVIGYGCCKGACPKGSSSTWVTMRCSDLQVACSSKCPGGGGTGS